MGWGQPNSGAQIKLVSSPAGRPCPFVERGPGGLTSPLACSDCSKYHLVRLRVTSAAQDQAIAFGSPGIPTFTAFHHTVHLRQTVGTSPEARPSPAPPQQLLPTPRTLHSPPAGAQSGPASGAGRTPGGPEAAEARGGGRGRAAPPGGAAVSCGPLWLPLRTGFTFFPGVQTRAS